MIELDPQPPVSDPSPADHPLRDPRRRVADAVCRSERLTREFLLVRGRFAPDVVEGALEVLSELRRDLEGLLASDRPTCADDYVAWRALFRRLRALSRDYRFDPGAHPESWRLFWKQLCSLETVFEQWILVEGRAAR